MKTNMFLELKADTVFTDVVRALDKGGHGVLALLEADGKLHGIVTDGDIRRAILNDTRELHQIINRTPEVANDNTPKISVLTRLKAMSRRHMPVVDNNGIFKGFISLDEGEWNAKPNSVLIMAGGLGQRLKELTHDTPKPMLAVGAKPILQRIIEKFVQHGFLHFFISVNYRKEKIMDYFGDGTRFGITIEYLEETQRLGTAGALSLLPRKLSHPLVVTNGDVLTGLDFDELLRWHEEQESEATMCVREFDHQVPYGVVDINDKGEIQAIREKPVQKYLVNAGIYILSSELIERVPGDKFFDMPDFFETLRKEKLKVKARVIDDYWIDVGLKEHFEQANRDFESE